MSSFPGLLGLRVRLGGCRLRSLNCIRRFGGTAYQGITLDGWVADIGGPIMVPTVARRNDSTELCMISSY